MLAPCHLKCPFVHFILTLITISHEFNLDIDTPVFKIGPENSYFGYSVALHFIKDDGWMLVGAPRGKTGQPGTNRTGALYSCPLNRVLYKGRRPSTAYDGIWCDLNRVEYDALNLEKHDQAPDRRIYYNNKADQLLGAVVSSGGRENSQALVCAPNLVFDTYAYMDGACYLLANNLTATVEIRTCQNLIKTGRHNGYGQCQEGFSAVLREDINILVTGLPGVEKWTGGIYAEHYMPREAARQSLVSEYRDTFKKAVGHHSYLGYSVGVGTFGFWQEVDKNSRARQGYTVVAGSPRYNETGAVFFMPYSKNTGIQSLTLFPDYFKLTGSETFASTFGYSIAVLDIDNNGFDDLVVGAPNYYDASPSKISGGAVFVYFTTGKTADNDSDNSILFHMPFTLTGRASFGLALTSLGDVNKDGYNDFAVGAPFDISGGSVSIFLGSPQADFDVKPSQVIYGRELKYNPLGAALSSFGWSLSGGVDLDGNSYPDLLVGAFNSSAAILIRSKPVIVAHALIDKTMLKPIDKERPQSCGAATGSACFTVRTITTVNESTVLIKFKCRLEVLIDQGSGSLRAQFSDGKSFKEWDCPASRSRSFSRDLDLFIPESNRDWLNPIKMKFTVLLPPKKPPVPRENGPLLSVDEFPVLDTKYSIKEFKIEFDDKCGDDKECQADLNLTCSFPGLTLYADNDKYLKDAGKDTDIDVNYVIRNHNERAYETLMYVQYDETWFERPQIVHGKVKEGKYETGMVEYILGNPLLDGKLVNFTIRFSIVRDKTGRKMPREPLGFYTFVNTTSVDTDSTNNNCSTFIKIVTKTELSLNGYATPRNKQLLYGGKVTGESAMEFFEDVGPEVQHIYELKNEGPWPVNDIWVDVDFPYEVNSTFSHGKWALYITDEPTILVANPGQTAPVTAKPCDLPYKKEIVNPLQLKAEILAVRRKRYAVQQSEREAFKGDSTSRQLQKSDESRKLVLGRRTRELRIKPKEIVSYGGEKIKQVTIDCSPRPELRTAKCVQIRCPVKFLAHNGNATITIISRLWNSTFVEDYRDVQIVEIISRANITVPTDNPIEETDYTNNIAMAITEANPDLPGITEQPPIPLWIIILAVLGGIFLLLCLILLLWKCGFFKRRRHRDEILYRAEVKHNEDFDSQQ